MADQISRVDYYSAIIANKPGEAARILTALEQAGINLVAFSGFPEGRKAQVDFIAADGPALVKVAKSAGVEVSKKKTAFLVQGEDHVGAAAAIARKLADAGINIISLQTICAGETRFGGLLWVKAEDVRKAAKLLGAT
jgi:hypothetical protein